MRCSSYMPAWALCALAACGSGEEASPHADLACETLAADECQAASSCAARLGAAPEEYCKSAADAAYDVFAGCGGAGGCEPTPTCASGVDGQKLVFATTCVPPGWASEAMSECCAGAPPGECTGLDQAACQASPECTALMGTPSAQVCLGEQAAWGSVFGGCAGKGLGGGGAMTCAVDTATGNALVFASTLVPTGWGSKPLDGAGCCAKHAGSCTYMAAGTCSEAPACTPVEAMPAEQYCAGAKVKVKVGCIPSGTGCAGGETCGKNVTTGARMLFPDSCLPDGWKAVGGSGVCCGEPPPDCTSMDQATCKAAAADCKPLLAEPAEESCAGVHVPVFSGCVPAGLACGVLPTCGVQKDGGAKAIFGSTCVPEGWEVVGTGDACCGAGCDALYQAQCEADPSCTPLMGKPAAAWCSSSGSGGYGTAEPVFAGCRDAAKVCSGMVTCAKGPSGDKLMFPDSCIPQGWKALDDEGCCDGEDPPSWTVCTEPSDCTVLEMGCCDHCNGGWLMSVAVGHAAEAAAKYEETDCDDADCTKKSCSPVYPTCPDGECSFTSDIPADCEWLGESSCGAAAKCLSLLGTPADAYCAGEPAPKPAFAGCTEGGLACSAGPKTCAVSPGAAKMMFSSACIPAGWTLAADCCGGTAECAKGDEVEVGKLCVRGETSGGGEVVAAGKPVKVQLYPKGCFSSSCTEVHEASCSAGAPKGGSIAVSGIFCLSPAGSGACTPDCSGGGFAACQSPALAAGDHVAKLGSLEVSFTVPSTLPSGGKCAGSAF